MGIISDINVLNNPTASSKAQGTGALSSLDQSTYDFSTSRYPLTVGSQDVPHYVVFNINLPTNSKYTSNAGGQVANVQSASQTNYDLKNSQGGVYQASTSAAAGGGATRKALSDISSGTVPGLDVAGSALASGTVAAISQQIILVPKLQRVKKAIAIYMPDTVVSEYSHDWNTVSLTEALGKAGSDAALGQGVGNIAENLKNDAVAWIKNENFSPTLFNNAQGAEAVGAAAQALGAGPGFTQLALRGTGQAINPQVEMIFNGTKNRTYNFVFDFQPRSATESAAILDIIKTFRMYAAPEISSEGNGRYFIPPAQFDISFYFNNKENDAIAKISTCALTQILVNYAGSSQYTTFQDGMPVHINMTLSFIETDIITREMIDTYGY
jgi:hypothetical protein